MHWAQNSRWCCFRGSPHYLFPTQNHWCLFSTMAECRTWDLKIDGLKLKLGQIPNFSIRYTFDFHTTRFNLAPFLTLILISSTFDLFSIRDLLEERISCSIMTWYSYNMSILLGMATSDCKNNDLDSTCPKTMGNLTASLILILHI